MNERIKELALLSGQNLIPFMDPRVKDMIFERFAELIVKECMKVADEGMAQVTMRVEWPSYHIKKHFGVEE